MAPSTPKAILYIFAEPEHPQFKLPHLPFPSPNLPQLQVSHHHHHHHHRHHHQHHYHHHLKVNHFNIIFAKMPILSQII